MDRDNARRCCQSLVDNCLWQETMTAAKSQARSQLWIVATMPPLLQIYRFRPFQPRRSSGQVEWHAACLLKRFERDAFNPPGLDQLLMMICCIFCREANLKFFTKLGSIKFVVVFKAVMRQILATVQKGQYSQLQKLIRGEFRYF